MALNFLKISKGISFTGQSSVPTNPANGDQYYNSTRNTIVEYINGNWTDIQSRSDVASGASLTSANFTASVTQSSFVRLTGSTSGNIHGLTASSDAKYLLLYNESSTVQIIKNQSTTESTAGNRIITPIAADLPVAAGNSILLTYDGSQSRWIVVGTSNTLSDGLTKNYLNSITTSQSSTPNTGNGNFENGNTAGWNWCSINSFSNSIPNGSVDFTTVSTNALYSIVASTSTTASVGDTYTNNGQTFTIVHAITASTIFIATGTGDPTASGTLTRATGSGTASVSYTSFTKETMSTVSSGQLAGSYSLSFATTGVTYVGLGFCSDAFNIDNEDQAKVLTWKFYYKAQTNPGNVNWSGTSSNGFGVAVYDVTNSTWLPSTAVFGMTQSSGIGYATGTFQTASNGTQLRLVVYNANAFSGATTVYFDDFFVGPQTAPMGPAVTDWTSYTPTGSWSTNTTYTGEWRRVGDSMEMRIRLALAGAPTTATLTVTALPTGYTIDTTKVTSTGNSAGNIVGHGSVKSAGNSYQAIAYYNSSTVVNVATLPDAAASTHRYTNVTQASPGTFASGDEVTLLITVPISGWSSNLQMSNDTDTRIVAVLANAKTPTGTLNGSLNTTVFGTVDKDTHGGYNTSTGVYTVPVSGQYWVWANLEFANASVTVNQALSASIKLNSSTVYTNSLNIPTTSVTRYWVGVDGLITANAGDTIQIQAVDNQGTPSYGSTNGSSFSINRLSGPSIVAATESVNMRYTNTAGTSVANSGETKLPFATKDYDSHNAFVTDTYTVPVSGKYHVTAGVDYSAATYAAGNTIYLVLYKNNSVVTYGPNTTAWAAISANPGTSLSASVNCLAGDTLDVRTGNNRTAGATTLQTTAGNNHISIERVGN